MLPRFRPLKAHSPSLLALIPSSILLSILWENVQEIGWHMWTCEEQVCTFVALLRCAVPNPRRTDSVVLGCMGQSWLLTLIFMTFAAPILVSAYRLVLVAEFESHKMV